MRALLLVVLRYNENGDRLQAITNAPINVKPEGGDPGICGAFDFSEDFLVKVPTVGPQNCVK